jgi:hypothetical protein
MWLSIKVPKRQSLCEWNQAAISCWLAQICHWRNSVVCVQQVTKNWLPGENPAVEGALSSPCGGAHVEALSAGVGRGHTGPLGRSLSGPPGECNGSDPFMCCLLPTPYHCGAQTIRLEVRLTCLRHSGPPELSFMLSSRSGGWRDGAAAGAPLQRLGEALCLRRKAAPTTLPDGA